MLKKLESIYAYVFACLWIFSGWLAKRFDGAGDWLEDQVDHNDYLAGALIVTSFMIFAWMLGAVQIVWLP